MYLNKNDFIDLKIDGKEYRYSINNAIQFAFSQKKDLIEFRGKYYVDDFNSFIINKSTHLNIKYHQYKFNLLNNIIFCDRNDTNNRLDYNLTCMKKDLINELLFDGEKLIELDIANAQFAICSYLNDDLDYTFKELSQTGNLYQYIEDNLHLKKGEGKELMFRITFGKIEKGELFNKIRFLFPKFMEWIDTHKKEWGYKKFSNILQKKESVT